MSRKGFLARNSFPRNSPLGRDVAKNLQRPTKRVYTRMMPSVSDPSNEACLCMALRRASREATRLYDEAMRESGLRITQYSLLRNIGRAGTINVTELARRLDLERTAMGRNLDLLERKGLVRTLDANGDQRTREVSLTEKGFRIQAAAVPIWRKAQTEMKRRLESGDFASLSLFSAAAGA